MKLRSGLEIIYCMENHPDYETLSMFLDVKDSKQDLLQKLSENLDIQFHTLISLYDWNAILNKLDEILNDLIKKHAKILLLQETNGYPLKEFQEDYEDKFIFKTPEYINDVNDIKIILKFYTNLLSQCFGKEYFCSSEVSFYLIFFL